LLEGDALGFEEVYVELLDDEVFELGGSELVVGGVAASAAFSAGVD
jgi:hypothetical protein